MKISDREEGRKQQLKVVGEYNRQEPPQEGVQRVWKDGSQEEGGGEE